MLARLRADVEKSFEWNELWLKTKKRIFMYFVAFYYFFP